MPLQYVQNKPHASEFAFSHVPAACRSCVKNYYMLYMQEERGREREREIEDRGRIWSEGWSGTSELPVMYCFHKMPRTLKTSYNWP